MNFMTPDQIFERIIRLEKIVGRLVCRGVSKDGPERYCTLPARHDGACDFSSMGSNE